MIKIGVIADTHIQKLKYATDFLDHLATGPLQGIDMLFHAGDMVDPDILVMFDHVPVHAVRGNRDPASAGLEQKKIVTVASFRIGLMHGWGACAGLERRLIQAFSGDNIDCLVYGHTHYPCCRQQQNLLLFNPGSATERRTAPYHSVGILRVEETISGEIIRLD
ncbi:MAG: metallophosphoesterase family protein [Desulfuromonadales bacterium]|nr:metallophosphoesterase family protein [Desulfuromonadales bacterium]MDT8422976.1 metallophosphoesterase family protein [Desulfuromonadales bacterium]